jgi:chemotaxis signal transduction protein
MEAEGRSGEQIHFLVFELSGQRYGVDIDQVLAVVEGEGCEGLWCYEGEDVPLQWLARWIGLDQAAIADGAPFSRVLLSRSSGMLRGFMVDTPQDIVTLSVDQIFPVPALIRQVLGPSPLWGVGRPAAGLLLLVDLTGAGMESRQA